MRLDRILLNRPERLPWVEQCLRVVNVSYDMAYFFAVVALLAQLAGGKHGWMIANKIVIVTSLTLFVGLGLMVWTCNLSLSVLD